LKGILPLLAAAKLKLGILGVISYFVIGFFAKKAIELSVISLIISAFVALKTFWSSGKAYHHEITPYNGGWNNGWSSPASGGWASGSSSGWEDPHYAHNQAYSGYHH